MGEDTDGGLARQLARVSPAGPDHTYYYVVVKSSHGGPLLGKQEASFWPAAPPRTPCRHAAAWSSDASLPHNTAGKWDTQSWRDRSAVAINARRRGSAFEMRHSVRWLLGIPPLGRGGPGEPSSAPRAAAPAPVRGFRPADSDFSTPVDRRRSAPCPPPHCPQSPTATVRLLRRRHPNPWRGPASPSPHCKTCGSPFARSASPPECYRCR